jgi:hypothetical protein
MAGSEGLSAFDVEVPRDQGGCEGIRGAHGEGDTAVLEHGLKFAQTAPLEVAGEGAMEVVDVLHAIMGEDGFDGWSAGLHDHAEVLAAEQVDAPEESLGGDGIVEGSEEEEEGAAAETDADEGGEFLEVWGDGAGLEVDELFAAGTEVGGAVVGADERLDLGSEGDEAEEVALTFGDGAKDEGGLDELFEERFGPAGTRGLGGGFEDAAGEAGSVDDDIHLLRPFDLEDLGDRVTALGGGAPVDVVDGIAGDVLAELLEVTALADLPEGARTGKGAGQEGGVRLEAGGEVGLDADLALDRKGSAMKPESEGRRGLGVAGDDGIGAALRGEEGPDVFAGGSVGQTGNEFGEGGFEAGGKGEGETEGSGAGLLVQELEGDRPGAALDESDDGRELGGEGAEQVAAAQGIEGGHDGDQSGRADGEGDLGGADAGEGQGRADDESDQPEETWGWDDHAADQRGTGTD